MQITSIKIESDALMLTDDQLMEVMYLRDIKPETYHLLYARNYAAEQAEDHRDDNITYRLQKAV